MERESPNKTLFETFKADLEELEQLRGAFSSYFLPTAPSPSTLDPKLNLYEQLKLDPYVLCQTREVGCCKGSSCQVDDQASGAQKQVGGDKVLQGIAWLGVATTYIFQRAL